jgi:hypothetical protein
MDAELSIGAGAHISEVNDESARQLERFRGGARQPA